MALKELLTEINDDIKTIISPDFNIDVKVTNTVPSIEDNFLTYENLDEKRKKVKVIKTCVLYVDIRKSTELNLFHKPQTLSKLYASFTRSMIQAADYYNGHVRNIIGDRLMIIFDEENCFTNAINTAILINTISSKIINKHFKNNDIKCGIGIDYGDMMVSKVGTIKKGHIKELYRSLVWLGRPANIASKLTDKANKNIENYEFISVKDLDFSDGTHNGFILTTKDDIFNVKSDKFSEMLFIHEDMHCLGIMTKNIETSAILITEEILTNYKKENPKDKSNIENYWKLEKINIEEYSGKIYGGNLFLSIIDEVV
jgi:adenylate cyclase